MVYKYKYQTPNGFSDILMNSDGKYLTGLWFEGSRDIHLVARNQILHQNIK